MKDNQLYQIILGIVLSIMLLSCDNSEEDNSVTDIDGNVYNTITVGTQVFMLENLKVTKYRNGVAIPNITDNTQWSNQSSGACCNYDNNLVNDQVYGKLYNWYSVNTGQLCPDGWHIPTDSDWSTLSNYLGGDSLSGGILKATTLWDTPNIGASNSSGFTAVPSGYRDPSGSFFNIGRHTNFWSSTEKNMDWAYYRHLYFNNSSFSRSDAGVKQSGFSCRCIKD